MTTILTMRPNATTSVDNVKTGGIFDVLEDGQEVGRIWTERSGDVKPGWQFKRVKDGWSVGDSSELFDTKEDAPAAFEKKFYKAAS